MKTHATNAKWILFVIWPGQIYVLNVIDTLIRSIIYN